MRERPSCKLVRLSDCLDSAGFYGQGHTGKAGVLRGVHALKPVVFSPGQHAAWHRRLLYCAFPADRFWSAGTPGDRR